MRLYCLRCNLDFLQIEIGDEVYQLATHSSYKQEYHVYWSDQEVFLFVLFRNINFSKENELLIVNIKAAKDNLCQGHCATDLTEYCCSEITVIYSWYK